MANSSRMMLRTLMLTEPWLLLLPPYNTRTSVSLITSNPFCGCRIRTNVNNNCIGLRTRRISYRVSSSNDENIVSADGDGDGDVEPPQEAVLKLISVRRLQLDTGKDMRFSVYKLPRENESCVTQNSCEEVKGLTASPFGGG
ncbi:hypothetical protein Tco_1381197 [Tanacetum coccineum]